VRVASAAKLFPSITEATNKYAALRSEAASLIDASDVEESFFTGDVTEEYD
jgi:selenocysteine lyase/cysteine desulfurase